MTLRSLVNRSGSAHFRWKNKPSGIIFPENANIFLDKPKSGVYNEKADFGNTEIMTTHGGVTQLVEYPVHTRYVTCSNQVAATRPVGQAVKTPPFHGGNMGSIPVRVTKKDTTLLGGVFFGPYGNRRIKCNSPGDCCSRGLDRGKP